MRFLLLFIIFYSGQGIFIIIIIIIYYLLLSGINVLKRLSRFLELHLTDSWLTWMEINSMESEAADYAEKMPCPIKR